jgi:hypothetical protein
MQQRLRAPISKERNSREDAADSGVRAAVPVRRMWLAIFAAIGSREL